MVYQVSQAVDLPILGIGGIVSGEDVVEFLLAGATAVGIGTANIMDPLNAYRIKEELCDFMEKNSISSVSELIGGLIV